MFTQKVELLFSKIIILFCNTRTQFFFFLEIKFCDKETSLIVDIPVLTPPPPYVKALFVSQPVVISQKLYKQFPSN